MKVVQANKAEEKKEPETLYQIQFPETADLKTVIKFLNLLSLYVTVTDKLTPEYIQFIKEHPECCKLVSTETREDITVN